MSDPSGTGGYRTKVVVTPRPQTLVFILDPQTHLGPLSPVTGKKCVAESGSRVDVGPDAGVVSSDGGSRCQELLKKCRDPAFLRVSPTKTTRVKRLLFGVCGVTRRHLQNTG